MRIVVLGAGGIGGTIAARLHLSGHEVAVIARGAHGAAIRERGLTFATPRERVVLRLPVYDDPAGVSWTSGDVVVLAVKSQDTEPAARDLAAAAGSSLPVVAAQNGVANERVLSRWFSDVHGMCVMMPTEHLEPGLVVAASAAATGILDLGRHLGGTDEVDDSLAAALRESRIECVARPDIMRWKYRKLLNNLGNAVQALCRESLDSPDATAALELLTDEAEHVLSAAGIDPVSDAEDVARRGDHLRLEPVSGARRGGGSTWQSLARGSGVETDYLNGEIALLGRLYDAPAPANARIQALMAAASATGAGPGTMTAAGILAELRTAGQPPANGGRNSTD